MYIKRPFWEEKLNFLWKKSSIIWLQGVRRSGKTTLAKSLEDSLYLNCDLPSVQEELSHPEHFLKTFKRKILVLDEIHQLPEATMILKIAADNFNQIKVLATGSSSLIAGKKFKDSLTGRKRNVHFLPVMVDELSAFKQDLKSRILHGGLPPALLAQELDLDFYGEWLDSFYARDIQEIFAIEKRQPFLKALEYLLVSNSNLFDVTKLSQVSGISRPTAVKYLDVLESTNAITILRPFSGNSEQELVSQPKVYGFDTGFCCYCQGIRSLGPNDTGAFLENLTLETFQAYGLSKYLKYWRTKTQKEIDFIYVKTKNETIAIECKWKEKNFSDDVFNVFRRLYPKGENWVITSDSLTRIVKSKNNVIHFINIEDLGSTIHRVLEGPN